MPSIPHKDYLPDITGPEPESDYEHEDEQGGEEEYDDYQDNLHQNDWNTVAKKIKIIFFSFTKTKLQIISIAAHFSIFHFAAQACLLDIRKKTRTQQKKIINNTKSRLSISLILAMGNLKSWYK